jgi:hypothetical protein
MNYNKAKIITDAAADIGMALIGKKTDVDLGSITIIRSVSLGQMETAADQMTAENVASIASASDHPIHTVCDSKLLQNVKRYADSIKTPPTQKGGA